jgi:hypothetical protein
VNSREIANSSKNLQNRLESLLEEAHINLSRVAAGQCMSLGLPYATPWQRTLFPEIVPIVETILVFFGMPRDLPSRDRANEIRDHSSFQRF